MDCTVQGVSKSGTQLRDFHFHFDSRIARSYSNSMPTCLRKRQNVSKVAIPLYSTPSGV